jgi:hypothetical protein
MALTRDSKETIRARVQREPGFREALLREFAIRSWLCGTYSIKPEHTITSGLPGVVA